MKLKLKLLITLLIGISIICNGQETMIKGKVHHWPTDTVYLATLPFHSPYSSETYHQVISADSTFEFKLDGIDNPCVVFIIPEKKPMDLQLNDLLYRNLTDDHYYGHCIKVYTYGLSTHLIEPGKVMDLDLTFNSWISELSDKDVKVYEQFGLDVPADRIVRNVGKTQIIFGGDDKYSLEYYQTSFNLDDKCDKTLERSKSVKSAIKNLNSKQSKLLSKLEKDKDQLTPFLYEYIKAEIEFGARKEFLKYLRFDQKEYLTQLFESEIPQEIMDIVEFDKDNISHAILINEEYNEYLENYLNFMWSIEKGEYIVYKEFDKEKFTLASKELPAVSRYYYLANNLLQTCFLGEYREMAIELVKEYPNGELNEQLKKKIQ